MARTRWRLHPLPKGPLLLLLLWLFLLSTHFLVCEGVFLGGLISLSQEEISTNEFAEIVQHSTQWYNTILNKTDWHASVGISDATKQVVQGLKYRYRLHLKATDCQTEDVVQNRSFHSSCLAKSNSPQVICSASVWHRPWLTDEAKISEIQECWEVTDLDVLLTEVHHAPRNRTEPEKEDLLEEVQRAVDELNLNGLYTNVHKLTSLNDSSQSPLIVELDETACNSTTHRVDLEMIKLMECYNQTTGNILTCAFGQNKLKCGPVIRRPLRFMWRLAEISDMNETHHEVTGQSWIKQPLHFDGQLYAQVKPNDSWNATEFSWIVNKSVELYGRNVKTLYPNDVIDPSAGLEERPVTLCSTWTTQNKTQFQKCEPMPLRPVLRSTSTQEDYLESSQKIEEFYGLLRQITNAFLTTVLRGSNFTVLHVSKLSSTNILVWFGECDYPTELPCLEGASPLQEMRKKYMQCEVDIEYTSKTSKQIGVTNCWQSDVLANFTSPTAKWNKLSPADIRSPEIGNVIKETVKEYHEQYDKPYMQLDHVTDFFMMDDGDKKSFYFVLHLKNEIRSRRHHLSHRSHHMTRQTNLNESHHHVAQQSSASRQILHQCNVVFRHREGDKQAIFYNCQEKKLPELGRVGAPRKMRQDELNGVEFDRILRQAHDVYNQKSKPENVHRLHGYKDAEVQVVSGIMTKFKAYYVETACKRILEGPYFVTANGYDCERENQTHITVCQVVVWKKSWLEKYEKYNFVDCHTLLRNITLLNDVRIIPSEHHLRPAFSKIISTAATLVNEKLTNFTHYFQVQQTTKPEYEKGPQSSMKFKMIMRATDFIKGLHDVQYLENQNSPHYSPFSREILMCDVTCKTDYINREDLTLTIPACVLVHRLNQSQSVLRHPATLPEVESPEFRESVEQATGLFNRAFGSSLMYGRPEVENVFVEDMVGRLTTFQLHIFPNSCANPVLTGARCEALASSAVVSCQVRVWHQPWNANHKLVHVDQCTRYQKPTSAEEVERRGDLLEDVAARAVPKLTSMFSRAINSSEVFSKVLSENVEVEGIAGRRAKFDLLLAANQSECTNMCDNSTNGEQQSKIFYQCRAVAWLRPWLNDSELLQLSHCKMILHQPITKSPTDTKEITSRNRMKYIMDKAVDVYNTQLSGGYIHGLPEHSNLVTETDFGTKTQFDMQMKQIACRRSNASTGCKDGNVHPSIRCQVTHRERPWDSASEVVSLRNCRKVYDVVGVAGVVETQVLTPAERDSDEFQNSLKTLLTLFRPPVPIIYEVKSVQNATVKTGETRNITFEMILQPIGCDESLPGAADKSCQQWMYQDSVQCSATISDSLKPDSLRSLHLINCRTLWRFEEKRPLSEDETKASWFEDSVKRSAKLQRQMFSLKKYYKVLNVADAYLQRNSEEIVTYKLKLIETVCPMPVLEDDLPYLQLEDCDAASTTGYVCDVTVTRKQDGSVNQQVNCASSENVLIH